MPSKTARLAGRTAVCPPPDRLDEDARTALFLESLKECQAAAAFCDSGPVLSPTVDRKRAKIWDKWKEYCDKIKVDHIKIWRDYIDNCLNETIQATFQGFLLSYCRSVVKRVIVLDDREVIWALEITTRSSVVEIWRQLVAAADKRAIAPLRSNPDDAQYWKLRWDVKYEGTKSGPAFLIVQWIQKYLGPLLELDAKLPYSKRGFSQDDIAVFVDTLWLRPHLISCSPLQRLSVHAVIILAGLGGFRPGMLSRLKYAQFHVLLVRDGAGRRRVAVNATIYRNKVRKSGDDLEPIHFTILAVPDPRFCFVRLLISRAIQADAFDAGFKSYDELIQKPKFDGNTRVIPLNWKQHLLEEDAEIFPLPYGGIWSIWQRTLLVAGYRDIPRLYALRVGAGRRLDGVLSPSMRNWFMSHTTAVFERSYMAEHFPGDLLKLAFGQAEADTDAVFPLFTNTSTDCDPGAPLFLSSTQEQEYNQRRVVAAGKKEMLTMPNGAEKTAFRARMNADRRQWQHLKLMAVREECFKNADKLRSLGLHAEPAMPFEERENPPDKDHTSWFCIQVAKCAGEISARVGALVAYLRGIPDPSLPLVGPVRLPVEEELALKHRCLLCRGKDSFGSRPGLSRHHLAQHVQKGIFNQPFPCPECMCMISSAEGWSNHVERYHGRAHAPSLHNLALSTSPAISCFACDKKHAPNLYVRHLNTHIQNNNWPSLCAACGHHLEGMRAWLDHLAESHLPDYSFCVSCGFACSSERGATKHLLSHRKTFQAGPCQICQRLGLDNREHFEFDSWVLHVQCLHQSGDAPTHCRGKRKAIDDESSAPALPKRLRPEVQGTAETIDFDVLHQSGKPTAPCDENLTVCDSAAPPDAGLLLPRHHGAPALCEAQNDYQRPTIPSQTSLKPSVQETLDDLGGLNTIVASVHADAAGEGDCITVCDCCHTRRCIDHSPTPAPFAPDASTSTTSPGTSIPPREPPNPPRRRTRRRRNLAGGPTHGGDSRRNSSNIGDDIPRGDIQTVTRILRGRVVVNNFACSS